MSIKQDLTEINSFLKSKINLIAIFICGAFSAVWMFVMATRYYYSLNPGDWDTAIFNQILSGLLQGTMFNTILGVGFLGDHSHFLAFLLAPIYWIFPDPMFLKNLTIFLFFIGAYILFLLLKKKTDPWIALGVMIAFIMAPANVAMLRSCFSFEVFAIPLVFLIFKFFDEKKYWPYIICCLLLALTKEQMPLIVLMFGVYAAFLRKEDRLKWALVPLLMGLIIFFFENFYLTPHVRSILPTSQSYHWSEYKQFGKEPKEIFLNMLTHPLKVLEQFVSDENIKWYNELFGVWGGLAFLSPHVLLPAALLFPKLLLSGFKFEHTVTSFYYSATFTPFIFLAVWNTMSFIQTKYRLLLHVLVLGMMLIHASIFMPKLFLNLFNIKTTNKAIIVTRLTDQFPVRSAVLTNVNVYNLKQVYWLNNDYFKGEFSSHLKFNASQKADYLFVNMSGLNKLTPDLINFNFDDHWKLKESIEEFALYVNNPAVDRSYRLIEKSDKSFLKSGGSPEVFENSISLEDWTFPQEFSKKYRIFPISMYWKSVKPTKVIYDVMLKLKKDKKVIYEKRKAICSGMYSTSIWRKGEYIKEDYFYLLPRLEPGEYQLELKVYVSKPSRWVKCVSKACTNGWMEKSFVVTE